MLHYVGLKKLRSLVCFVTKDAEDPNNWGENDFMKNEVQSILENCPWNRIYDIIEYFYANIQNRSGFEKDINEYFIEKGIGWKLVNGLIETRIENDNMNTRFFDMSNFVKKNCQNLTLPDLSF